MTHHEILNVGDVVTGRCATNYTLHTGPVVELREHRDLFGRVDGTTIVIQSETLGRPVILA